jgi:hypothetical protein
LHSYSFRPIDTDPARIFGWMFFWHTVLAGLCAALLFGLPGFAALRALRIAPPLRRIPAIATWLLAPAMGLCTFGPWSFLSTSIVGFSNLALLASWLLCVAAAFFLARWRSSPDQNLPVPSVPAGIPSISNSATILLIIAAMLWAAIPAMTIYPGLYKGALYADREIGDHLKIGMVDGIAREGMPARNPFYAPDGKRILLSYSYGWHFLAAELKKLTRVSGWEAEVAMTWYTGFAMICFLAAIACGLTGKASAGLWVVLLAITGPLSDDMLPILLGPRWLYLIGLARTHPLEIPWIQMGWAPQHALSGLAVALLLWLLSGVLSMEKPRLAYMLAIGLVTAAGFECSVWVGGFALMVVSPLLLVAVAALRLPMRNYLATIKTCLPSAVLCLAALIPLLLGLFSGTQQFGARSHVGFGIYESTYLETHIGLPENWQIAARIVLFWIHLLPLSLAAIYVVGLPAMFAWRPQSLPQRTFRTISLTATFGFLLVTQFLRSTIANNDLGWRSMNVSLMFLLIWAAAALADIPRLGGEAIQRWRQRAVLVRGRAFIFPLAVGLLALSIVSTAHLVGYPIPPSPEDMNLHRQFAQQAEIWAIVRTYTKPTDLVQSNPDGFADLPPYPCNLPYHLFADRPSAYGCFGSAYVYAFRHSSDANYSQYHLVEDVFSANPRPESIQAMHDRLGVKAIVVIRADPVWSSNAIAESGLYRRVVGTRDYRIFIAIKPHRITQATTEADQ